jgi:hypothetical protein
LDRSADAGVGSKTSDKAGVARCPSVKTSGTETSADDCGGKGLPEVSSVVPGSQSAAVSGLEKGSDKDRVRAGDAERDAGSLKADGSKAGDERSRTAAGRLSESERRGGKAAYGSDEARR